MKKILTLILTLSMSLGILCRCQKQTLPVPEYPLNADTIVEAMQECGLSYTIQEDDWVRRERQGQSMYNLYHAENDKFFVISILSGQKDGERILFISLPPFFSPNTTSMEECENTIVFATLLFGGFENAHQVYDNFTHEYDTVNTEKVKHEISDSRFPPKSEGDSRWERKIDGTTCRIILEQPTLSEQQEYLNVIMFASDLDTFYSE